MAAHFKQDVERVCPDECVSCDSMGEQGRGQYSMAPHSYVEIPKSITDKIVEKRNSAD